jgi:hypothetical protein
VAACRSCSRQKLAQFTMQSVSEALQLMHSGRISRCDRPLPRLAPQLTATGLQRLVLGPGMGRRVELRDDTSPIVAITVVEAGVRSRTRLCSQRVASSSS